MVNWSNEPMSSLWLTVFAQKCAASALCYKDQPWTYGDHSGDSPTLQEYVLSLSNMCYTVPIFAAMEPVET